MEIGSIARPSRSEDEFVCILSKSYHSLILSRIYKPLSVKPFHRNMTIIRIRLRFVSVRGCNTLIPYESGGKVLTLTDVLANIDIIHHVAGSQPRSTQKLVVTAKKRIRTKVLHECQVCSKTFNRSDNRNRHVASKHPLTQSESSSSKVGGRRR
jgi:hypothetical protein